MTEPKKRPKGHKTKSPTQDRHRSTFMMRFPEVYRRQFKKLRPKTRRPMTEDALLAFEEYLAKHGLWPPEEEGQGKSPPREG